MSSSKSTPSGCGVTVAVVSVGALLILAGVFVFLVFVWGGSGGDEVTRSNFKQGEEWVLPETVVATNQECLLRITMEIEGLRGRRADAQRPEFHIPFRIAIRTNQSVLHAADGHFSSVVRPGLDIEHVELDRKLTTTHSKTRRFHPPPTGKIRISMLVGEDERFGAKVISGTCVLIENANVWRPWAWALGMFLGAIGLGTMVIGGSAALIRTLRRRGM